MLLAGYVCTRPATFYLDDCSSVHVLKSFYLFLPIRAIKVLMYSDVESIDVHNIPHVVIGTYPGFCARTKTTKTRLIRQIIFITTILDKAHNAASFQNMNMLKSIHSRYPVLVPATKVRKDEEL